MTSEPKILRSAMAVLVSISRVINIVAMVALVAMMMLTVSDVFLRYTFKIPITDSLALTEYLMVCTVFFAVAWCAAQGKHVSVDLLVARFSPRVRAIFSSVTYFLGLGVCVLITWRSFLEALVTQRNNRISRLLEVPAYPFYLVLAFGFALLCLVMFVQWMQYVFKAVKE